MGGDDRGHSHNHSNVPVEGDGHADVDHVSVGEQGQRRRQSIHVAPRNGNLLEAQANQRKLRRATTFVLVFFVLEVIGGIWSGSLAIVSDAAHLLADVSGFILAMVANEIASQPACDKLTYGPVRAEVLSALFSTVTILVLSMFLVYSAIARLIAFSRGEGEEVNGKMMSFIALVGLIVNVALIGILGHEHGGHDHSHGHAHSHDDDGHHDDVGNGGRGGCKGHRHGDVEGGLVTLEKAREVDGGERAPLVYGINGSSPMGIGISGISENSGGTESAARGTDKYGSLVVADGVTVRSAGVEGFPELQEAETRGAEDGDSVVLKKKRKKRNINMEAAILHAVTDLVQSAGVLLAGLLIWYDPRFKWADPIATLLFVGLVVSSTRHLLNRAFNVLLEGVPDSMDYDQLRKRLSDIEGVTDLHCLHVWSLTVGRTVVSAHIKATDPEKALASAHEICEAMGVAHSTIQVQVDHCLVGACPHPCVSAVGGCCETDRT